MKKILENVCVLLSYIILTPICILVGIGLAFYLPVDYVRYRRSAFYQDTGHRYELFSGGTPWIQLYNAMRKEEMPLDFYLHVKDIYYGYFRYKNILLVQDFPVEYVPEKQGWFVYHEDEAEEACTTVLEALEGCLESFHEIVGEKLCDRAVLLVDRTHIPEEDLSHMESCDLLLGYDGQKNMAAAIKQWIEKN